MDLKYQAKLIAQLPSLAYVSLLAEIGDHNLEGAAPHVPLNERNGRLVIYPGCVLIHL